MHIDEGPKEERDVDIAVIGGGMIGAAIALGFAQQGRRVALVENHNPIPFDATQNVDLRVSALSPSSIQLLTQLGVWQAIVDMRACPYHRLTVWEHEACKVTFDDQLLGLSQLGYIVENRVVQWSLWQQLKQNEHVKIYCPDSLERLVFEEPTQVTRLSLTSGQHITARWVIGADGANSFVRQHAKIGITAWDYRQYCMLIHVETDLPQQDITWQHFYPSGPRAFLPLLGNQASLVWYDSFARIKQLSAMKPEALGEEIMQAFPSQLGNIRVLQHGFFPLTRRHAHTYSNQGCILVGDAAHTVNPLAGQGVNLGYKDVHTLLSLSANGHAITQAKVDEYERKRRPDNLLMQTGMDAFYCAFSTDNYVLKFVRNSVFMAMDRMSPMKRLALKYAVGMPFCGNKK